MQTNATDAEESIDEKRARYEAFEFAVCRDGEHVNVANVSYGEEERGAHIYSVTVEDGEPVSCSCPHHQYRDARCKHIHAVASNEVVQRAIEAAQAELLPDGGQAPDTCKNGQEGCEGPDGDALPCWECFREAGR